MLKHGHNQMGVSLSLKMSAMLPNLYSIISASQYQNLFWRQLKHEI